MMKIIIDFNIFTITFISMQQLTNNDKINFRIVIYLSIIEIHYGLLYHLLNFKYMKNTLRGVLLFVKVCNFTKSNTPPWVFFTFFRLYKWYQIAQNITSSYSIQGFRKSYKHRNIFINQM